jgi:cephalosporin hydroxylase
MNVGIETERGILQTDGKEIDLYSDEAFRVLSELWVKVGWSRRYPYTFSWMGLPIIQLPEDMIRYQEVIARLRPDVIVETGVAHGGSAIFSASLCKMLGTGRVIAIEIAIRPQNRRRIEEHPLSSLITLIEGSSTAPEVVARVRSLIGAGESVLVMLDSNHGYAHVSEELDAYAPFITPGSYLIATDGVMEILEDVPRGGKEWSKDNPARAARDFAARRPEFVIEQPVWPFNESTLSANVTHWPDAWLRRKEDHAEYS